jgi:simple sugar transport system ATP-binding protein
MGERQQVEILKMLWRGAEVLILDEPTAVLTPQERDRLFETLRDFRAAGKAILLSTHKLEEVMAVSDRVSVMRAGRLVESTPTAATSREAITRAMIGRPLVEELPRAARPAGGPVLALAGLSVTGHHRLPAVRNVSLTVGAGEIVGIAGVAGNGQKELVEAVVGLRPATAGTIAIAGREVTRAPIGARRAAGLAYVPEDRQTVGLGLSATVAENAIAGRETTPEFSRAGRLRHRAVRDFAVGLIERFGIRVRSPRAPAGSMSGGNRQKLVIARELARGRPLLVVENPTWGVDIGASELIHRELIAARDAGCAILLVSTELTELLKLADRVLVMFAGAIAGETAAAGANEYEIGRLMTGAAGVAA